MWWLWHITVLKLLYSDFSMILPPEVLTNKLYRVAILFKKIQLHLRIFFISTNCHSTISYLSQTIAIKNLVIKRWAKISPWLLDLRIQPYFWIPNPILVVVIDLPVLMDHFPSQHNMRSSTYSLSTIIWGIWVHSLH